MLLSFQAESVPFFCDVLFYIVTLDILEAGSSSMNYILRNWINVIAITVLFVFIMGCPGDISIGYNN